MFPFPAILIGIDDRLTLAVRDELTSLSASVESEYNSVDSVLGGVDPADVTARALIVGVRSTKDIEGVRRLSETLRNWPIVALVEMPQSSIGLIQANRAGAAQVVPVPLQNGDLSAALNGIALQFGRAKQDCLVIAFTGSASGCGTTTIATNAAFEIAERHKRRTVLVELTQKMGVLATNLDLTPVCTLADLLADMKHVDTQLVRQSLIRVAENFEILAGRRTVGQAGSVDFGGAFRILDYVQSMAEIVVLDVPCTDDNVQFELLARAHQVVLVGEQSVSAVRSLNLMLDTLRSGSSSGNYQVVINRYDPSMKGLSLADLERVMQISGIRAIPDDRSAVLAAVNEGRVLRQVNANSTVLAAVDSLVDHLLAAKPVQEHSENASLFRRMLNAFKN